MTVAAPPPPPQAQTTPSSIREDEAIRASRMLALATKTAERHVNEAKAQADQMVNSAKTGSDRMMAEARAKSEQMVTEAKNRADSMLGDARTRADTMEREAGGARLPRSPRTPSASTSRRSAPWRRSVPHLDRKIEELKTYEREYRTRLRSYLESAAARPGQPRLGRAGGEQPAEPARPRLRPGTRKGPDHSVPGPFVVPQPLTLPASRPRTK